MKLFSEKFNKDQNARYASWLDDSKKNVEFPINASSSDNDFMSAVKNLDSKNGVKDDAQNQKQTDCLLGRTEEYHKRTMGETSSNPKEEAEESCELLPKRERALPVKEHYLFAGEKGIFSNTTNDWDEKLVEYYLELRRIRKNDRSKTFGYSSSYFKSVLNTYKRLMNAIIRIGHIAKSNSDVHVTSLEKKAKEEIKKLMQQLSAKCNLYLQNKEESVTTRNRADKRKIMTDIKNFMDANLSANNTNNHGNINKRKNSDLLKGPEDIIDTNINNNLNEPEAPAQDTMHVNNNVNKIISPPPKTTNSLDVFEQDLADPDKMKQYDYEEKNSLESGGQMNGGMHYFKKDGKAFVIKTPPKKDNGYLKHNVAARILAEEFGIGKLIVNSKLVNYDGKQSLLMENAKTDKTVEQKDLKNYKLTNGFAADLGDLEVFDRILGNTDREVGNNKGNYFMYRAESKGNKNVTSLCGIDNDFCFFGSNKIGRSCLDQAKSLTSKNFTVTAVPPVMSETFYNNITHWNKKLSTCKELTEALGEDANVLEYVDKRIEAMKTALSKNRKQIQLISDNKRNEACTYSPAKQAEPKTKPKNNKQKNNKQTGGHQQQTRSYLDTLLYNGRSH